MIKLLRKHLKPFAFGLLLAIALLFLQAWSDLSLPDFMSDIVNIGIQQSGIQHAAPDAINENGYKLMTFFMSGDDKAAVERNYTLAAPDAKKYPDAGAQVYLKGSATDDADALDTAFANASYTFVTVMKDYATPSGQEGTMSDLSDIDFAQIYQMLPMLANLPQAALDKARETASGTDPLIVKQIGVLFAKEFLLELGADISAMQTAYIMRIGVLMLLVALAGGVATVSVSYISSKIAAGVARNLRGAIFDKVSSFTNAEFDKFSTASLITRTTNDVTQVQMLLQMGIRMMCYSPIMAVGGVIMALEKSVSMSWIIAAACLLLLGLILVVFAVAMPKFKLIQKLVDKLNLVARENLMGMMVIRAFGTQKHEEERFDAANKDVTNTHLFISRVMVTMMPIMMLIMNGIMVVIIWVGSHQIAESAMQVGDMMAFMQYAMQIIMSFLMISMMFIMVPRAAVSCQRILEVLDTEASVKDPIKPKSFGTPQKGVVEFRNVSFRYEGAEQDALETLSFTARPGQTTAIIGSTGSGKSTVANLLLRFYDATSGQVLVNGTDVREVSQHELRQIIGYVPQKGVLLSGTIESNLKYGDPNASGEVMEKSAEVAQALEFINERPEKYGDMIAQNGGNVSGGQKQRLSIARALVKRPDIFIFDDSFSALDFKTDVTLRRALKEYTGGSTVIVVAQRVGTIMNAEQILVLDKGKIVGRGTHKELLKSCPEYYEIASSQLSGEELEA